MKKTVIPIILLFFTEITGMQRALQLRTFPKKTALPLSDRARELMQSLTQPPKEEFIQPFKQESIQLPKTERTHHCKRLIILLDPKEEETFSSQAGGFLRTQIFEALASKAAPLLVTKDLIAGMCHGKETYEWKQHWFYSEKPNLADKKNYANETKYAVSLIPISDNWFCYAHKTTGLLLFIPKLYPINNPLPPSTYAKIHGFDVSNLDVVNNSSAATLLQYIDSHKTNYTNIPQAIESMLIHNKEHEETGWIIYLSGHGATIEYPTLQEKKEELTNKINVYVKQIVAYQNAIANTLNEQKIDKWNELIKIKQNRISECQDKIKAIEGNLTKNIEENILHDKEGAIAGLPANDFFKLMSIFSYKIKTFFLYYVTCYATGFNQMVTNRILSQLNVDFIVATQGMTETDTYSLSKPFAETFETLDNFFYDTTSFISTKLARTLLLKDPLQKIMSTLVIPGNDRYRPLIQPFMRLPKIGTFKAIGIDNKIKILTNTIAVAHQLENSALDYTDKEILAIIAYPPYVAAPLHINSNASIVSPTPDDLENQEKNIHVFEKIIYNNSLFQTLLNLPKFNQSYYNTVFVIKELQCLDEENSGLGADKDKLIILKNVVICTRLKDKSNLESSLDVMFTHNDTQYLFFNGIIFGKHIKGGMLTPYLTDNNPKLLPTNITTRKRFATSLLEKKEADNLSIYLPEEFMPLLIKKLQEKINMPVTAQAEAGDLKTVLEELLSKIQKKGE